MCCGWVECGVVYEGDCLRDGGIRMDVLCRMVVVIVCSMKNVMWLVIG